MKMFFPYPEKSMVTMKKAKLRLVNTLDVKKEDLGDWELVVYKDILTKQTLLASTTDDTNVFDGFLFEKLLNLEITKDVSNFVPQADREKIITFVENFATPYNTDLPVTPFSIWGSNRYKGSLDGNKLDWLFFPYNGEMSHRATVGYFERFQAMYLDIVNIAEAIKNNNLTSLQQFDGVFNTYLRDNYLKLLRYDSSYSQGWRAQHSSALCYLELLSVLVSKSKIKLCKYCNCYFESPKGNTTRCINCRNSKVYRQIYYSNNIELEREKARERMRRRRNKSVSE